MKRILILTIFTMISAVVMAQTKVAVWETKCNDNSITSFQSTMVRGGMETAVGNTPGYEVYDRSSFDAIMKEHNFQRSGAVSDSDIKQMGIMTGVQYIIVPEAIASDNEIYIIVKMIDIESGQSSGIHQKLCGSSSSEVYKACADLGAELFGYTPDPSSTVIAGTSINSDTQKEENSGSDIDTRDLNFIETAFDMNMTMVYVQGGTFTMGCTDEQGIECYDDESPSRETTVSTFYIGMLEVTQSQWEAVMGTTVADKKAKKDAAIIFGEGSDYPMYFVSWNEANEFCQRLSQETGKNYRLPTEAEWEYAARGGIKKEGYKFSGGYSLDYVGWYTENSNGSIHPCGTKKSNALGIYDMSGNVWEWCNDLYGPYMSNDTNNPKGAAFGTDRVLRGGCWDNSQRFSRVSLRSYDAPTTYDHLIGFRVACDYVQ